MTNENLGSKNIASPWIKIKKIASRVKQKTNTPIIPPETTQRAQNPRRPMRSLLVSRTVCSTERPAARATGAIGAGIRSRVATEGTFDGSGASRGGGGGTRIVCFLL